MPIEINEIRIKANINVQEDSQHNNASSPAVNVDAIIAAAVESVMERLKELKED